MKTARTHRRLRLAISLLCLALAGCVTPPAGKKAVVAPDPEAVLTAYLADLRAGQPAKAEHHLVLHPEATDPDKLRVEMMRIADEVMLGDVHPRILDRKVQGKVAVVLYSLDAEGRDPLPCLLFRGEDGVWKLYNRATSGPVHAFLKTQPELAELKAGLDWAKPRLAELAKGTGPTPEEPASTN
jgi:hypothetical protein